MWKNNVSALMFSTETLCWVISSGILSEVRQIFQVDGLSILFFAPLGKIACIFLKSDRRQLGQVNPVKK